LAEKEVLFTGNALYGKLEGCNSKTTFWEKWPSRNLCLLDRASLW